MHEYSVVQALIERVEAEGRARNARSVRRISLRIGELAGVEPELLRTAYENFREHTMCASAALDIRAVPAEWSCPRCGRPAGRGRALRCDACGRPARLVRGDEIILDRIEMDVA